MGLALVTGASSGIGFQLALQLGERGYDVVGVGASTRIRDLGDRIAGVEVVPVQADLATAEGVEQVWAAVEGLERPLDVACSARAAASAVPSWTPTWTTSCRCWP